MSSGVTIISAPTREHLNERQLIDYREHKQDFVSWLRALGKDPDYAKGYAETTINQTSVKIDQAYRWLWSEKDGYTKEFSPEEADGYIQHLVFADADYSNDHYLTVQKALKRLFRWREYQFGEEVEWEPEHKFKQSVSNPRDFLSIEERKRLREAALEYGAIPSYHSMTPAERDRGRHISHSDLRSPSPKSRKQTGTARTAGRFPASSGLLSMPASDPSK